MSLRAKLGLQIRIYAGILGCCFAAGEARSQDEVPMASEDRPPHEEPAAADFPLDEMPSAAPEPDETQPEAETPAKFNPLETEPPAREWKLSARLSYQGAFEEADPTATFRLSAAKAFGSAYSFFLIQDLLFNLVTDASKDMLEVQDTAFGVERELPKLLGANWTAALQLILPISRNSRFSEIYNMPELSSELSLPLTSWYKASLAASAAWIWSAYQTAPGEAGQNGETLPLFGLNLIHESEFEISEYWEALLTLRYAETVYHDLEYEGAGDPAIYEKPTQGYNMRLGLSRRISLASRVGFSYSQGSTLLQPGFDDYVIYDSVESRWTLSLSHSF